MAARLETEAVENNGKPTGKGAAVIRRVEVAEEDGRVAGPQPAPAGVGDQRGPARGHHRLSGPGHVREQGGGGQQQRPGHHPGGGAEGGREEPDQRGRRVRPGPGGRHRRQAGGGGQRGRPGHRGPDRAARPAERDGPADVPSRASAAPSDRGRGRDGRPTASRPGPAAGRAFAVEGMQGRSGATKDKLLKAGGGNTESEAAVARGLAWLARKQLKDGSWEFDGSPRTRSPPPAWPCCRSWPPARRTSRARSTRRRSRAGSTG